MNNFTTRIISGAAMIALIVSLIFTGGHIGVYVLANIIGIFSMIEFFKLKNIRNKLIVFSNVGYLVAVLFTVVAHFPYFNFTNVNTVVLFFLGYLIFFLGVQWYHRKQISEAIQWFAHLYITIPMITFVLIPTQGFVFPFNPTTDYQPYSALMIFVLVWSSDSWAYVAGKLFGKHKLAPSISPGKTWEGFIGGAILTAVTSWAYNKYILTTNPFISDTQAIILGLLIATFGTLGDLFESSLKRKAGVKDSGNIIPGHGGMLDRFDAFLFASVVMFLVIWSK
jgi:phosphatidate cytidylyltransferase